MKHLILAVLFAAVGVAECVPVTNAETNKANALAQLSPAERKERAQAAKRRALIRLGGKKVLKPGTRKGAITFVNAQKAAKDEWMKTEIAYLVKETEFDIRLADGSFDLAAPKVVGEMTIFITDDAKLPKMLVAPEDRWAMVNLAPVKTDKEAFFRNRTMKQMSRVFALLCGGTASNYGMSLCAPILTLQDLDERNDAQIPFDVFARMNEFLKPYGITAGEKALYRVACQEGWAEKPTNDIEQAIWDQVHAIPSKPIKIEFDPKKDK